MKQTRKTALAFLLTLCVTLGLLPALTVTVNAEGYSVTMDSMTNGSVTADKTSASEGDTVTLTITPEAGYELDALTVTRSDNGVAVLAVSVDAPSVDFPMPASNVNVSATFTKKAYSVNLGAVSNGALTPSASTAQAGDSVTLTVTPEAGYELDALTVTRSDNGESVTVTETSGAGSFTMPASNVTATATFKKISYPVEVQTVDGGEVSIITGYDADGSPITAKTATAQIGDTVTLDVQANDGKQLVSPIALFATDTPPASTEDATSTWNATQSDGYFSFTITDSNIDDTVSKITVAPRFTDGSSHNITVQGGIVNGTVTKLREKAPLYDTVRLMVRPDDGYVLDNLTVTPESGALFTPAPVLTSVSSTTEYWAFTMPDKDVTVSATFTVATPHTLYVKAEGGGKAVAKDIGGNEISNSDGTEGQISQTALVVLELTPNEGYELTNLTVTNENDNSQVTVANDNTFSMPTANATVTAVFKQTQTITPHGGGSDSATVVYGDTLEPVATAEGNATLTYEVTEGSDVINVDANGKLTALKVGSGVVHVEAAETNETDATQAYAKAEKDVTVTVTKRPLTVTANAQTKTAGESDPEELTYTVTGFAGTDTVETVLTGALARVAGEAAGEYAITQGTLAPNDNYVIAYYTGATLTITAAGPSYTVTAADTTTDTDKKYQYGDEFTIAVTVSGADFEGGEFTLTYDKDMFQLTAESVAPGKNDNDAKNTKTNQTGENSNGQYDFSLNNGVSFTDGNSLVNLTFKVIGNVSAETDYTFAFKDGKASVCYGLNKDTVAATTVTGATVTVEPSSFDVTLTGQNGVTFVKDSATITSDTAAYGAAYTVKIGDYDALRYAYPVTLKVGGTEVTDAPSPDSDGNITIPAASVTGAIELTVSRAAKFTVTITEDYVSGYSLITVAKTEANTENTIYAYGDTAMYYVNAYGAYACIVSGAVEQSTAEAAVKVGTASAGTITNGTGDANRYDVNGTGKTDYSDALLTYRCYVVKYETPTTAMETYLRADVNGDKKADTTDVSAVDSNRTQETT